MRNIERRIIHFARNRGAEAVCLGNNPEGEGRVYYLVVPGSYNPELEEEISELELDIINCFGENVSIARWPSNYEQAISQGFMGRTVYKRESHSF